MDIAQLKDYDFWLAAYTDRMDFPYKIKMWQYTNTGTVPGIAVDVDINVFFPET
jgi:GH25 family lysozyme M1 (1,4-beta-N-acetylmuramidase)